MIKQVNNVENQTIIAAQANWQVYNKLAGKAKGGKIMANIHERIKELRTQLHLSQDYVAKTSTQNTNEYSLM